jgi:predicted ribosome quality control (RQC) complex YloA/Tae2 family protein
MLSLSEMRRSVALLEPIVVGRRVQRLIQPDDDTVALELFGWDDEAEASGKLWLVLSAHAKLGRIAIGDAPTAPPWPPDFAAFLKARMNRAKVTGLRLVNDDRLAALMLEGREGQFELVLSLMGPRSNLFALDADGKVVAALKETTRTGKVWENPAKPEAAKDGDDRWAKLADDAYLQAVRSEYAAERERLELDTLRKRFEGVLKKELEFAERRTVKLERDLQEAKQARDEKRHGELLKQVMSTLNKGDTHVLVRDYETGEDVNVKLDPNLTPVENLEKYFKKYHKGLVGTNMLGQQLEITKGYLEELRTLQQVLSGITEPAALRDFAETPLIRELTDKHISTEPPARRPKKKPEKKEVPGKLLPRRYKTSDGLEVWVGKSDAGNDYLTTKLAAGNDWFFHIEGYPGSHTILRTSGRKDPPQESVLEAAEMCVHFSKMKDATRVDVHVVPIKNVHKPKGAKPGLVHVSQGKTIGLRRDPKRLERILAAKIE